MCWHMQMQVFEGLEYSEVEVFQKIIIIFIASINRYKIILDMSRN